MIKKAAREILLDSISTFRKWKAKPAIAKLISHESGKLKVVGNALRETIDNITSEDEQELISIIEQRRISLLSMEERIPVIDFGVGIPSSNRTEQEMKRGIQNTALICQYCAESQPAFWAMLLFKLIRKLKPSSCVELGSCVGISASYQAAALSINKKGKLLTLEGSPEIAKIAEESFRMVGLQNASVITGPFHENYTGALETAKPVDFLFNDGHHDHDAVLRYFYEALPYLSDNSVIVLDDISWSQGMRKAWTEIEDDERVDLSIDLHKIGIAFVSKKETTKRNFR